jgi:hypothetical protein
MFLLPIFSSMSLRELKWCSAHADRKRVAASISKEVAGHLLTRAELERWDRDRDYIPGKPFG